MLLFIGALFDQLIGKTVSSVTHAAETKIENRTIGRAQAKVGAVGAGIHQKALRGVDRAIDSVLKPGGKK